jgi:hypothetical protein
MSLPARERATYDDVLAAPDGFTAEILMGELHLTPRPSAVHQAVNTGISWSLFGRFGRAGGSGPGGWLILTEVELHLGDPEPTSTVVVPDLSGWRRERLPEVPDTAAIAVRPDWVCEILSPGAANTRRDRVLKQSIYHQAGVPWLWIVDPVAHTVEVLAHRDEGYLITAVHTGHVQVAIPPFEAEAIDLGAWWPGEPDEDDGDHD